MSIRKVNFAPGEYYHIYNRGNDKRVIFHDAKDYDHFMKLMYLSNNKQRFLFRNFFRDTYSSAREGTEIAIGAYCLMPNHFHILATQMEEGSISKYMQKLTTAYSMYYNKKYKRSGTLFEGKFKSQYLGNDRYLKYLFSYIHLNPIKIVQSDWKQVGIYNKNEAIEYLKDYRYSSFNDFIGFSRPENKILDYIYFPDYFPTKNSFVREIFEWLSYHDKEQD